MTKQFLFILDPLESLAIKTDTSLVMMKEAHKRGIAIFACELKGIVLIDGKAFFKSAAVDVTTDRPFYKEPLTLRSADEFQAIFMRKDPPVDDRFLTALFILRCHDPKKTKVINSPNGILCANEKIFGLSIAHDYFPKTLVSAQKDIILDFLGQHKKIVIKPLFNAGGSGVLVFDEGDLNLSSGLEILTNGYQMPVMVQSYIPKVREGDKRVIVVGGKALGAVMRVPRSDDHRANFHAGGSAKGEALSERDYEIVHALAPHLIDLGLYLVGIDIIGGYLTEINVTSPTCVVEIEALSQKSREQPLRAQILDYIEELI